MEKITHQGTVIAIKGKNIEVKIINHSACMQCLAHNHCGLSEQKEKIISIFSNESSTYKIGDKVSASLTSSNGLKAVVYGYIFPLILLLVTIIITHSCGYNDFIITP